MTSKLGDILELMHGASDSFRTVRVVAAHRLDGELVRQAAEEWRSRNASGEAGVFATAGEADEERPRVFESTIRLWVQRPDRAREETEGSFPRYGVRVGETWWAYDEHNGAMTNDGDPHHQAGIGDELERLLDPAALIPHLDFEVAGETVHAARRAIRVEATFRGEGHRLGIPLAVGLDRVRLLVDAERGVLLRMAGMYQGAEADVVDVQEIAFDEELDPQLFEFAPPVGEELRHTSERQELREVPVEDVAARAGFTVFIVAGLEEAWRMRAVHHQPERAAPAEQVHLHYFRQDAGSWFGVNEQSAEAPRFFTTVREPEEIERAGVTLRVVHRHDDSPLAAVRLVRETTAIELISDNVEVEQLIAHALALAPVDPDAGSVK